MKRILLLTFLSSLLIIANAQNPIAYWEFDENTFDSVTDIEGYVQPESYTIMYDNSDSKVGSSSIVFDGNYYLDYPDPAVFKNLDAFTVAFWMKWDGSGGNQSVFEKDEVFRIIILDGGYLDFLVATENNAWYSITVGKFPTPPIDQWVHIAFYYNGSKIGFSMNGGENIYETAESSVTGKLTENNNDLLIGGSGVGNFKGKLDDIRFYNTALDATAIKVLADPNGIMSPIAEWQFENNTLDMIGTANGNVQPEGYTIPYDNSDIRQGSSSIKFDGNYYLNCLDPDTIRNLNAFTVAFWMKWDGSGGNQSVFEKDEAFRIIILDGGYLDFLVATENNAWYSVTVGKFPTPPVDKWVHIAFYYDGSKIGFSMNGGENTYETVENSITGKVAENGNGLLIGGSNLGDFKGKIDDIKFYNIALSIAGIKELYNSYPADLEPPTTPTNLSASNIGETSFDLNWEASTDNAGIAAYYILMNNVCIDTVSSGTLAKVTGLKPETEYMFGVIAADINGNLSDTSNIITIKTLVNSDFEAPTTPQNIVLWDTQFTSLFIGWAPSTDNVAVAGYKVYQDGQEIQTVVGTYVEIKNLAPGTSYEYMVKAFDAAGNMSGISASLIASTLIPPSYPAILLAHWTFEGNTLNVVPDATEFHGNIIDGDLSYNNDLKEGTSSLSFNGKAFLNCGEPIAATEMEALSIALWMKVNQAPESSCPIVQEGSEYSASIETIGQDSIRLLFAIATEHVAWWGGAGSFLYDTTIIHSGEWHHVAFIYSGIKTKIYLDGKLTMENPYYITGKTLENGNNLVIGGQTGQGLFNGLMDDVRFYSGALTDDEIKQLLVVTSVNNMHDFNKNIHLYPNPAVDRIQVRNVPIKSEIKIFTLDGQTVYNTLSEGDMMSVDVSYLTNGIYFLSIENGKYISTQKFIISR